jgi:hypothetical protein
MQRQPALWEHGLTGEHPGEHGEAAPRPRCADTNTSPSASLRLRPIPIDWIGPSSASEMNYPAYAPHVAARLMQAAKRFRPRTFEDIIPEGIRRHSRMAGACIGGVGGCSWGGGQY